MKAARFLVDGHLLILLLVLLLPAVPALAATTIIVGTDASKTVIKGTFVTPDQVVEGELVIDGDTITCVDVTCDRPPGATLITVTDAFVFPGFVDAHNHVAYNVLPRWNPPRLFQRRSQWQATAAYGAFKAPYTELKDQAGLLGMFRSLLNLRTEVCSRCISNLSPGRHTFEARWEYHVVRPKEDRHCVPHVSDISFGWKPARPTRPDPPGGGGAR